MGILGTSQPLNRLPSFQCSIRSDICIDLKKNQIGSPEPRCPWGLYAFDIAAGPAVQVYIDSYLPYIWDEHKSADQKPNCIKLVHAYLIKIWASYLMNQ